MAALIANVPDLGGYLSIVKIVFALAMIVPLLYLAPRVNKDAKRAHAHQTVWGVLLLGGFSLAALLWLAIPFYVGGFIVYLVLSGAILAAYVIYRNSRVPEQYRILTREHIQSLLSRRPRKMPNVQTRLKMYSSESRVVNPPNPQAAQPEEVAAYNLTQQLLYDIIWHRASEAAVTPAQQQMSVRLVIDGVSTSRPPLSLAEGQMIIQYLKPIAGLDINEFRRPQKGEFSVDFGSRRIDLSVSTAGTTGGQQMQFRIIQEVVRQKLDELGMSDEVLETVRKIGRTPGLLIVAGRAGSGITSTLYSLLRIQDAFVKQLVTLEEKQAVQLENITQTAYGSPAKLAGALEQTLRDDPDVIMVDQCPNAETAAIIAQAAATKTILLGIQAEDSFSALVQWVKLCGASDLACRRLHGVLCQLLLRKLCTTCREAYRPDPKLLAKANLPASQIDKFYRPPAKADDEKSQSAVCPTCQGLGYFERTAAFELLVVTDEIRQIIASNGSIRDVKSACRKNKMLYLQEQALKKVIAGVTSIQEVMRAAQGPKK